VDGRSTAVAQIVSLVIVFAGYCTSIWVFDIHRFASSTINVEAGQKVVSAGPYRWVRHPMYLAVLFMMLFTPLALASYLALPFFALIIPILAYNLKWLCGSRHLPSHWL
jgi:protein-S-isoprenylcysteine O-methyltransferase Ste14